MGRVVDFKTSKVELACDSILVMSSEFCEIWFWECWKDVE